MKKKIAFWLTHIGVFLTLLFMSLGSLELQKLHVRAFRELPENMAISDKNEMFLLPFQITLKNFEVEFYDNHQPKSYKADIILQNDNTEKNHLLQVNHPARFMGYDIYLSSYDLSNPNASDYVILKVVYDPWVYPKYVGILTFLAGLFLYVLKLPFTKNKLISLCVLAFGLGFSMIPFSPYLFGTKNLVPALQSWWFVPHIVVYMFSYGALTIATLLAVYTLLKRLRALRLRSVSADVKRSLSEVETPVFKHAGADVDVRTKKNIDFSLKLGTILMGIGFLFGMLWGKTAWGNFWNFDLKENLALLAWIAYLGVLHLNVRALRATPLQYKKTLAVLIIFAYLLLQLCWFGVNLLPEFLTSLHRY
jgi:ABC-type transport system involved in cytochrome c biogenesis permease subunit